MDNEDLKSLIAEVLRRAVYPTQTEAVFSRRILTQLEDKLDG